MKKLVAVVFMMCSLLVCTSAVANRDNSDVVVSLQINNPIMEVNGISAEIDEGYDTKPVIIGGRTLVPIRAIVEAFNGEVDWDGKTRTVFLDMGDDSIKLVIDSKTAYLNSKMYTLDVAPIIINGRTMLPIRFVAEGFNLGVAWESDTRTVSIIKNSFDTQEYNNLIKQIPSYSGAAYVTVNNNVPYFKEYEKIAGSFEYYSTLDELGRCDVCMASISEDIMPTEERGNISSVYPTGWQSVTYDGSYLYNRCHLLGFQLTGENANNKNLITGTRYLNIQGMLPFENKIADYIEKTDNHVLYRVTPVFHGNNLVAAGVLLEAYSVEDDGKGLSFCVYCYNVQPNVNINYANGSSSAGGGGTTVSANEVYRTPSGKKYHIDPDCGGKNSYKVTLTEAKSAGLTPCQKCAA